MRRAIPLINSWVMASPALRDNVQAIRGPCASEVCTERGRVVAFACVVAMCVSSAVAQEDTVLRCEVTRDGGLIATPQLRLLSGRQGRLDLEWASNPVLKGPRERIEITPAVRGDDITLTFAIASGDKQFRPALVISKDVRGSIEWKAADGQPLRLTVSWVQ